jgi:outer membrane protein
MHNRRIIFAIAFLIGSTLSGTAQQRPPNELTSTLSRQQAEQIALKNNPRISVAQLLALAQKQVVRETRSASLPSLYGSATGVGAEQASRLSSGLHNSSPTSVAPVI